MEKRVCSMVMEGCGASSGGQAELLNRSVSQGPGPSPARRRPDALGKQKQKQQPTAPPHAIGGMPALTRQDPDSLGGVWMNVDPSPHLTKRFETSTLLGHQR